MAHVFTTVREWAAAQLAGLPGVAAVLEDDPYPFGADALPALVLATFGPPELQSVEPPLHLRWDVQLVVELVIKASGTGQAAALDALTGTVTAALAGTRTVGGTLVTVLPADVGRPTLDATTDQPVARREVVFTVGPIFTTAADSGVLV
ncbi:MAG TPA: hypothetical protein P5163_04815 [Rubrivivax sp.]|nr:hypothetical protein [Rubrivivax sp.]